MTCDLVELLLVFAGHGAPYTRMATKLFLS